MKISIFSLALLFATMSVGLPAVTKRGIDRGDRASIETELRAEFDEARRRAKEWLDVALKTFECLLSGGSSDKCHQESPASLFSGEDDVQDDQLLLKQIGNETNEDLERYRDTMSILITDFNATYVRMVKEVGRLQVEMDKATKERFEAIKKQFDQAQETMLLLKKQLDELKVAFNKFIDDFPPPPKEPDYLKIYWEHAENVSRLNTIIRRDLRFPTKESADNAKEACHQYDTYEFLAWLGDNVVLFALFRKNEVKKMKNRIKDDVEKASSLYSFCFRYKHPPPVEPSIKAEYEQKSVHIGPIREKIIDKLTERSLQLLYPTSTAPIDTGIVTAPPEPPTLVLQETFATHKYPLPPEK